MTEIGSPEFVSLSLPAAFANASGFPWVTSRPSFEFQGKDRSRTPAHSASSPNVQRCAGSSSLRRSLRPFVYLPVRRAIRRYRLTLPPGAAAEPEPASCGRGVAQRETTGPPLAQLLHHSLNRPAQHRLVRFFPDMHDGRQHSQQDAGMIAADSKAASDKKEIPAAVIRDDAAIPSRRKNRACVSRRQR